MPLNRSLLMRYLTNLGTEDAILVLPSAALYPRIIFSVLPFSVTFCGAIEIVQPAVGRNGEWADFFLQISWALGSELSSACALVTVLRAFAEGRKVT